MHKEEDDKFTENINNESNNIRSPDPIKKMTLLDSNSTENETLEEQTSLPISYFNGEGLTLLLSLQTIIDSKLQKENNVIDKKINDLLKTAIENVSSVTYYSSFNPKIIDVDEYFELQLLICTYYGESCTSLLNDYFVVENEAELYNYTKLREQEINTRYKNWEEYTKLIEKEEQKKMDEQQRRRAFDLEEKERQEQHAQSNRKILLPLYNKFNILKSHDCKIQLLLEELDKSYNKEYFCNGITSELTFHSFSKDEIKNILNTIRLSEKEKELFLSVIK